MLTRYKAWADRIMFATVMALPEGEALRGRPTRFGNMVRTLNHVHVVDDIFRAHRERRPHGYLERNTEQTPPLAELWSAVRAMDAWWIALADRMEPAERPARVPA